MRVLITGVCGFVGSRIAFALREQIDGITILGIDNLTRQGSEINRRTLQDEGIDVRHGDVRLRSDLESIPRVDWIIDASANPRVLAGVDGATSSRQLVETNLWGTIEMLEYCRAHGAGLVLLSTSRVYSIDAMASLPLIVEDAAFVLDASRKLPHGVSREGIDADFSTEAPVSLYGATKLASERIALDMPRRSASQSGSTGAAFLAAPASSAPPTRASPPTGSTRISAGGRCATSASTAPGTSRAMCCIHPTSRR